MTIENFLLEISSSASSIPKPSDEKILSEEASQILRDENEIKQLAEQLEIDQQVCKRILMWLKFKQFQSAKTEYANAKVSFDELLETKRVNTIVSQYKRLSKEKNIYDFMQINKFSAEDTPEKTTFLHQLFETNANKELVEHYLKALKKLTFQNLALINSYLALTNTNGLSINELVKQKSQTEAYKNIHLYLPNYIDHKIQLSIYTHTTSIHSSAELSLAKLASNFGSSLVFLKNNKIVCVDRSQEWESKISHSLDELKEKLRDLVNDNEKIHKLISDALLDANKNENPQEKNTVPESLEAENNQLLKLNTQIKAVLRLLESLKCDEFGKQFKIKPNELSTCKLTLKEIIAIGYDCLKDTAKWRNPHCQTQHFLTFIESLWIGKCGYNIEKDDIYYLENPDEEDDNKCLGGFINQIAYGLIDHEEVNIKIINADTMQANLKLILLPILEEKYRTNPPTQELINKWIRNGVMSVKCCKFEMTN